MYSQDEKDGMAMKNATIDKFSSRGDGDDKKIKSTDDPNKTYKEISYTKNRLNAKRCGSNYNCLDSSTEVDSGANSGLYKNTTVKLKTLAPTFIENKGLNNIQSGGLRYNKEDIKKKRAKN
jgi:hypothetical protein